LSAFFGAYLLGFFSDLKPIFSFHFGGLEMNITLVGLIIGAIVILSSLFELISKLKNLSFHSEYIPIGGIFSGFFGGLSGYQGSLRSAFLIKAGLNRQQFVGTSAICSIVVDVIRLLVYGFSAYIGLFGNLQKISPILVAASLTAFIGSYIGSKIIDKITFKTLQIIVGVMLLFLGCAIILGLGKQ
jgi:uncharacterized membrane protein YfcA